MASSSNEAGVGAEPGVFAWYPGGRVVRISPPIGLYMHGCVHPDGGHAVFWGGAIGTAGVWLVDLEELKTYRITSMFSASWHPAYGPGGEQIAFVSDRFGEGRADDMDDVMARPLSPGDARPGSDVEPGGGIEPATDTEPGTHIESHIFVMDLDGGTHRAVTSGPYHDRRPALSPDGARIAFVSSRGGEPGVWTVAVEGGDEPRPIAAGVLAGRPCWSADGATVYFDAAIEGASRLYAVAADGGEWAPLAAADGVDAGCPSTDAAGGRLLYHSTRDGRAALHDLPLGGGDALPLTPPGFEAAAHPSRARNGVVVFDVPGG